MKSTGRETRSDKFRLTLHPMGHDCKKIKEHTYYVGPNRKQALEYYLEQTIFLQGYHGTGQESPNGNMTPRRNSRYVSKISAY